MNMAELQVLAPSTHWLEFLFLPSPLELADSEPLSVYGTDYLQEVSELFSHIEPSILNSHLVQKTTQSVNCCFESTQKLLETLPGTKKSCGPGQQTCVSNTDVTLGFTLGCLSAAATFDWQSKEIAEGVISEITWRSPRGSCAAKEKADTVYESTGSLDFVLEPKERDDVYDGQEVSDSLLQNVFHLHNVSAKVMADRHKPPIQDQWSMTPQVKADHHPTKNETVFPASILQTPFCTHNHPKVLNFGGIGMVMGHERTRLGTRGLNDKEGNLWWNDSLATFQNHRTYMERQHSQYQVSWGRLTGHQLLGEPKSASNISRARLGKCREQWLPTVGLTHRQLFSVGFAQV
uniref:endothelin-converting enzyme 1 n=1 Tax=Mustela putorius furo TaxID=9669 RepID=M3Y5E6_MUSPF